MSKLKSCVTSLLNRERLRKLFDGSYMFIQIKYSINVLCTSKGLKEWGLQKKREIRTIEKIGLEKNEIILPSVQLESKEQLCVLPISFFGVAQYLRRFWPTRTCLLANVLSVC